MLTRKPVKGDRVWWPQSKPRRIFVVVRTPEGDDNLCWIREEGEADALPFIWRFPRTNELNNQATIIEE